MKQNDVLKDDQTSETDFMLESSTDVSQLIKEMRHRSFCNMSYVIAAILVSGMLVFASFEVFVNYANTSKSSIVTCGHSVSEAIALGCQFDNLSGSWVHASCYDAQLTAEHDASVWKYYRHQDGMEELDFESVSTSVTKIVWSTSGEHYQHCALALRKLHRALFDDGMIEDMYLHYNHTIHCTKLLSTPLNDTGVIKNMWIPGFLSCRKARSAVYDGYGDNTLKI